MHVKKTPVDLPAKPGEFQPLTLGSFSVWPPVVLAPMAGITNAPFRVLCRRFGAGLFVSEMVTARMIVRRHAHTLKLASFARDEFPRSLQLYGVEPSILGEAVAYLVNENLVDHIDLNFGCPVRKITSRGGGAAIPVKPKLLRSLVRAACENAGSIPVTIKFRIGIDAGLETYLTAGQIAQEEGCAAVAMHARTAAQLYQGRAQWHTIARLKQHVTSIPVLGNGDIWQAGDALRMMRTTDCDGVVVGRGCLGRPWLFRDLLEMFEGRQPQPAPVLGQVVKIMMEHARMLCDWLDEPTAMRTFRKHFTWYLNGFTRTPDMLGAQLAQITSFQQLVQLVETLPPEEPYPPLKNRPRLRERRGRQKVKLPPGYLENLDDDSVPGAEAELAISGG
ncbi:MAG: tRNA dihydrouridine synthase DusB [bacterium]